MHDTDVYKTGPLAQVAAVLVFVVAEIEQDGMQRVPSTPIEAQALLMKSVGRILAKAQEVGLVIRTPN